MDLEVVGRHALLFDDDAMAAFVNSGDALVGWHSLQIDRYDVRHLLSAPLPPRRRSRSSEYKSSEDPSVEFLIDQERYLDLPLESAQPEVEDEEKQSTSDGYHSVRFSYGNTDDSSDQKNTDGGMESSGYLPPFAIPGNIVQSLPPTEKVHQIIARTAIFVSKHGGQSEIILRVKQGDNPTFGFLMPDHHLHAYFRYLVEHPELLNTEIDEKSQEEEKKAGSEHNNSNTGALSLLGSVYGSGEDEDGDDAVNPSFSHETKKEESMANAAKDESISRKPILSNKEKVPAVKKNSSIIASKPKSAKDVKKEGNSGLSAAEEKSKNYEIGATSKPLILEPAPELKRLIDRLVEFIMRNGKQFEATLLEQDSKHERFPFLLPSNQYHPYYLKALQAAQESKINGKNFNSGKDDLGGRGVNRKAYLPREDDSSYSTSDLCDVPFESDRKEKFKMVIGKSKKEAQETEKDTLESGVTVDAAAAAAILQAATRGIKNSDLQIITSTAANSHNYANRSEVGQPASLGGLRPSQSDNAVGKSDQSGSYNLSAIAPRAVAGTASVGTVGVADSSDANLTKEQKLKAERLKRAKMFVAMLKSGAGPVKTGTSSSRGSSVEPLEPGVLRSASEVNLTSKKREGSLAPEVVNKPAATGYLGEGQSERLSKRKYHSKTAGCEDDEEDSHREEHKEGHSRRKYRSRSMGHEDSESEDALEKEYKHGEKESRRFHSSKENKNGGESSEEDRDHKQCISVHLSHHSQQEDNGSEGIYKEERDEKHNERHSKRKYRSRSRRHEEDDDVGNAEEKKRKHSQRWPKSRSSAEEENGEESGEPEHKHYKPTQHSHRSQQEDHKREGIYEEERYKEHSKIRLRKSHRSRSKRYEEESETEIAAEKEDKYHRKRHLSRSSYEEKDGGESSGDEGDNVMHRSYHSQDNDSDEDIYKGEKDRKRSRKSRHSHHSSHESSRRRHSSDRRKKHRSSHSSHHSRDKHRHRNVHTSKEKESRHRHKHNSSSDDQLQHHASSDQPEKESRDERDELEEGEISSKVSEESRGITSGRGKRGSSVDVISSQQRAASQPSEATEVPDDLRAKIRAMLMATRS